MKIQIEIEIQPFTVPNFVRRVRLKDEIVGKDDDSTGIPIGSLDTAILDKLCDDFKANVFKKAGKELPPRSEA